MKALVTEKVRMFPIISSVLAIWILLAAQPVQAQHAPTPPGCPSSSTISRLTDDSETTTPNLEDDSKTIIEAGTLIASLSGAISAAREVDYFQIIVPDLVVGELSVTASGAVGRTVARLCRGSSTVATHPDMATDTDNDEPHAMIAMQKVTPGTYYIVVRGQDVNADGTRLGSQDTHPTGGYSLAITFSGVHPTAAGTSAAGSLSFRGELDLYALTTTSAGLLTVKTTGNTDTQGTFSGSGTDMEATAEDGGSGGNFQIIAPVTAGEKTVSVQGQSPITEGDYTLDVDFNVAMPLTLSSLAITYGGDPEGEPTEIENGEADYFFFAVANTESGLMTIQTVKHASIASGSGTSTRGTLYGPNGLITTDDNSGDGGNFKLRAPVAEGNYIVKVEGQSAGPYVLEISTPADTTNVVPGATTGDVTVTAPTGTGQPQVDYYQIAVPTVGTLQVLTTGDVDTVGTLYGPDGREIVVEEDGGKDNNFKITRYLAMAGNYIVVVAAADRTTSGSYRLQTGFIEGVEVNQPSGGGGGGGGGRDTPPDPNLIGHLDEPPHNGVRSGIGIIRGWVCQDDGDGVQIRILNADGRHVTTITAPWGSSRNDVPVADRCDEQRTTNVGFAVQFNYNTLAEGTYRAGAWVGGEQVGLNPNDDGQTNTFRVVRISNQEFLQRVQSGRIPVENFPRRGDTTILEWDQQSQNFQIVDVE